MRAEKADNYLLDVIKGLTKQYKHNLCVMMT